MRIKITSDSTCDLLPIQLQDNDISLFALNVIKNGENFKDNVTITTDEIFAHVAAGGNLCTTAAGGPGEYQDFFAPFAAEYDGVLHVSLSSALSASYQNACLAAQEYDNVYVVDSLNLSTGHGLVVLKACELAADCTDLAALQAEVQAFTSRVESSFLVNKLEYLVKGGRCSSVAALGANLLGLKPCIEVKDGKMGVCKKYRGNFTKSLPAYIKDRLEGRTDLDDSLVFITHSPVEDAELAAAKAAVSTYGNFKEVVDTNAGCTISCHCGPGTLGILFVRK